MPSLFSSIAKMNLVNVLVGDVLHLIPHHAGTATEGVAH